MENQNIYKYAAKNAVRFFYRGVIEVEDLFDLDVEELDSIYKNLKREQKNANEESLINSKSSADKELEIKIAIVTDIVKDKLEAAEKAKKAVERKERRQKILNIIDTKQNEALQNKSIDELTQLLAEYEDEEVSGNE